MRKASILPIVLILPWGCDGLKHGPEERYTLAQVRDKLVRLHPQWKAWGHGGDVEANFPNRGFLVADELAKDRHIHWKAVKDLETGANRINSSRRPELDEKNWHGIVYLSYVSGDRPDEETPGWHGRVLVRNGCFFFGDKEMLKQIDKDLR